MPRRLPPGRLLPRRPAQTVPELPPPLRRQQHPQDHQQARPAAEGRGHEVHHLRGQHPRPRPRPRLPRRHLHSPPADPAPAAGARHRHRSARALPPSPSPVPPARVPLVVGLSPHHRHRCQLPTLRQRHLHRRELQQR
ncbi:hypothetical protein MUK42_13476 [Musa troglodytarum]|uniref:Uncharacterized protein n=1 Tax=Musa troglodytarum TaxID=320322 RepID=A0A9E7H773_9LILI|nr:hypothetical protein MUK42_13476 [Musa troglodytarum]